MPFCVVSLLFCVSVSDESLLDHVLTQLDSIARSVNCWYCVVQRREVNHHLFSH